MFKKKKKILETKGNVGNGNPNPNAKLNIEDNISLGNPNPSHKLTITDTGNNDASIGSKTPEFSLDMNIEKEGLLEKPHIKIPEDKLEGYYQKLNLQTQELKFKNQVLEWKIFGQSYKGKYIGLELNENLYIFGTNKADVKTIEAKSIKEAYLKFIEND